MVARDESEWEGMWAAYDEETYTRALAWIPDGAAVLDIGAGDLRLARRIAPYARVVYAIERNSNLFSREQRPPNLIAICGEARTLSFPDDVDTAVLLMRHCRHFDLYRRKLEAIGCKRLITNARWRMGVECIDLGVPPRPWAEIVIGWYACRCGAVGFRPGPTHLLTAAIADTIFEVGHCPVCMDEPWSE